MDEKTLARFERYVSPEPNTGCWLWTGSTTWGYGVLQVGSGRNGTRRKAKAHRLAFEHWVRPLADGLCLHRCDTPSCVNPDHLRRGDHLENVADRCARGRSARQRGESNGGSKLTAAAVLIMRNLAAGGATQRTLSSRFGVSKGTVGRIIRRERWGWLD